MQLNDVFSSLYRHAAFARSTTQQGQIQWSFATLEPVVGAFNTFTVEINGAAVSATRHRGLCSGAGMSEYVRSLNYCSSLKIRAWKTLLIDTCFVLSAAGRSMVQIGFQPPSFSNDQTLTIVVRATGSGNVAFRNRR
jgi:hypothetical protein